MTDFKNPVPAIRTIVNGVWSDILDCWKDTFHDEKNGTSQKVRIESGLNKTAFDELQVAQRDPEIQINAEYSTPSEVRTIVFGGTAVVEDGQFTATTGTGSGGFGAIFTDRQIISRPGQGSEVIYTARFNEPAADSRQVAGPSTASDSMFFGYEGLEFGVFFNHGGKVIVEELTITTPAGGSESTTITINGTGYTVPITSGTAEHNAFEISESLNSQVPLYNFTQNGATVVARSVLAAPESGSFSFSSPGDAVATWSQVSDGIVREQEFTAQADWSEGVIFQQPLDTSNINRYKIVHNGSVDYYIEDGITGLYSLVHRKVHTNVETTPMFSAASFRISWSASNLGNTTNLSISGTEAAAFNQGERQQIKATRAAFNTDTAVGTTATNIISIRCREVFGDKVNLGRIIPMGVSAFTDGNKGAIVQIRKGVTFASETNFSYIDKEGSIAEVETSQIEVSGGELLAAIVIGSATSGGTSEFNNLVLPGEVLTISMNVPSAAAADMSASLTWEEDL